MVTPFQFDKISFDIRYQQDMVIWLYCTIFMPPSVPIDLPDALAGPDSLMEGSDDDYVIETRKAWKHSWLVTYP